MNRGQIISLNSNGLLAPNNEAPLTILNDVTGLWQSYNHGVVTDGGLTVTNRGTWETINNGGDGISGGALDYITVYNSGIWSTLGGVNSDGIAGFNDVTVYNSGSWLTGGYGVYANDNLYVNNSGIWSAEYSVFGNDNVTVINSGIYTVDADDGVFGNDNVTVVNSGTFTVNAGGSDGVDAGDDVTVINSGTWTVSADDGVDADDNVTVTNTGTWTANDNGVEAGNDVTITNTGTWIATNGNGVIADDNLTVTNTGTWLSDDVSVEGDENTSVYNSGTMTSTNGDVVDSTSMDVENYGRMVATNGRGLDSHGNGVLNYYGAPGSELIAGDDAISAGFAGADDTIIIDNASVVSLNGDAMQLWNGDDYVRIVGHSHVAGVMDGEDDTDTIEFQLFGLCDEDKKEQLLNDLMNNGQFTYWGETYEAINFENIIIDGFSFADYDGLTYNQEQIAERFDCIDTDMPTDDLLAFIDTLYDEVVFGNFPEALNQLSPQRYEVFSKIAFNNHDFAMRHLNNRSSLLRENANGMWDTSGLTMLDKTLSPEFAQMNAMLTASKNMQTGQVRKSRTPQPDPMNDNRFGFFLSGNAVMAEGDGTPDIYDYEWDTYGVVGGFDYKLFPTLAIGLMGGYSHTDVDLDNYGSDAEVENYMFGIYANWWWQNFYLNGMFNYAFNEYEGHREVPFLDNSHHFDTDGDQFNLGLAGGYDFHLGNFTVGPTAGIRYVNFNMDGFTEGGHGIDRLTVYDDDADSLRTSLGLKANYAFRAGTVAITPELRAAWGHEFLDDSRGMTARFNSSQLNPFTIQTTDPERDWAEVGGSVRAKFNDTISAFVDYDAQVGQDDFFAHSVNGGLRLEF